MSLEENTINYQDIFYSTSNGVIATDKDGRIVLINQRAAKVLGLQKKRVLGAHILDVMPLTGQLVVQCLKTGKSQLGRHIRGKSISLVVNVTPIKKRAKISGSVSNFQKMQQFEQSAQQLESYKELNKQLETIIKSSSDGIFVYNSEGNVIRVNKASEKLNGFTNRDVIGLHYTELQKNGIIDTSIMPEVLETRRRVSILSTAKRTDKILLITGTPVFGDSGEISMIVVNERDMTQLNAITEELEDTRMITERYKEALSEIKLLELRNQEIIAESHGMQQVMRVGLKYAKLADSNILILGESGTGKGLLAKFIHQNSPRNKKPMIEINCAALPESLLEAELFGYEKGAFTGAREEGKAGLFELAHEGMLFLDEIGDLPLSTQAKLLKFLDNHTITRLGSTKPRRVDCIIIAATNRDLVALVKDKKFRQDLFFRLNTFTIQIPPLRKRPDDIFELVHFLLDKFNKKYGFKRKISPTALKKIKSYSFPGNVRELENILKMALVSSETNTIDDSILMTFADSKDLHPEINKEKTAGIMFHDKALGYEKDILKRAMKQCKNTREMAKLLSLSQSTVCRKMKKHGLAFT
jgi:PAS domain S-box-containing protein